MNAIFTVFPILLLRYGLLALFGGGALKRAAFFPPVEGKEKAAYYVCQISTLLMIVWLFFLTVKAGSAWFAAGLAVYFFGLLLYTVSIINYARPKSSGINAKGLYRISRNPMYIAFFISLLGCVLLTKSIVLFLLLAAYQISAHWIILSEERWCLGRFGKEYLAYMNRVPRYL